MDQDFLNNIQLKSGNKLDEYYIRKKKLCQCHIKKKKRKEPNRNGAVSTLLHRLGGYKIRKNYMTLYLEWDLKCACRSGCWKGCTLRCCEVMAGGNKTGSSNTSCGREGLWAHRVNWGIWELVEVCGMHVFHLFIHGLVQLGAVSAFRWNCT